MNSIKYLVGLIFVLLLIWGPINHTWTLWLLIRIGYLILIPLLMWFLLKLVWKFWNPNIELEDRIERALYSATSGVLIVLAIIEANAKTHIENTLSIQTRDGIEDVGDYITQQGVNWSAVIVLLIFAGIAFWFSISNRDSKE